MTDRIPLDHLTSDDLDALYAERARLTARVAELETDLVDADTEALELALHNDRTCEAVKRAEQAEACLAAAIDAVNAATDQTHMDTWGSLYHPCGIDHLDDIETALNGRSGAEAIAARRAQQETSREITADLIARAEQAEAAIRAVRDITPYCDLSTASGLLRVVRLDDITKALAAHDEPAPATAQTADGQAIANAITATLQQHDYSLPATVVHAITRAILTTLAEQPAPATTTSDQEQP